MKNMHSLWTGCAVFCAYVCVISNLVDLCSKLDCVEIISDYLILIKETNRTGKQTEIYRENQHNTRIPRCVAHCNRFFFIMIIIFLFFHCRVDSMYFLLLVLSD